MEVNEGMRQRASMQWKLRRRQLTVGVRTLVMGVVNITSDSFSDGGLYLNPQDAINHALRLLDEGADVLDLGAESTRPGSRVNSHAGDPKNAAVSATEEQARLLPVLEAVLKARPDALISVDTYKASTARAAVLAGAEIVNDVSGLMWDEAMAATCAELSPGVVLMHTRGRPEQWRTQSTLAAEPLLAMVNDGLAASLRSALDAGIAAESIVLDPGYGFGKRFDENYALLARQAQLLALGRPLLAGVSRKSFLKRTLTERQAATKNQTASTSTPDPIDAESVETATIAALVAAILNGASIVRAHSVRSAQEAAAIADAVLDAVLDANRAAI
jgi:dihydropteroate synthase